MEGGRRKGREGERKGREGERERGRERRRERKRWSGDYESGRVKNERTYSVCMLVCLFCVTI